MKKYFVSIALLLTFSSKAQYNVPIRHVHTAAHFTIGYGAGMMVSLTGKDDRDRVMRGVFSGATLGIAKEGYDLYMGGKPSVSDIVFTTAGGYVGAVVVNWVIRQSKGRTFKQKIEKCRM